MAQDILDPQWEDKEVIDYIIKFLDKDDRQRLTRSDIQAVLDLIVDYYDEHDLIRDDEQDENSEVVEDAEIDEDEMFNYIKERIAQIDELSHVDDALLQQILDGEYYYGVSIGIYSEDDDEEYGTYED